MVDSFIGVQLCLIKLIGLDEERHTPVDKRPDSSQRQSDDARGPRQPMGSSGRPKAANGIKQEAQGSQWDQAGGSRQPMGSSRRLKAANGIKQEAGFPSCFPDENLILAVFNYEELYNSKWKHDSSWLPLGRKCNWWRSSSRRDSRDRWWYSPRSFLFIFLYREPKIDGWLRSTGCFARRVFAKAFFGAAALLKVASGVIINNINNNNHNNNNTFHLEAPFKSPKVTLQ